MVYKITMRSLDVLWEFRLTSGGGVWDIAMIDKIGLVTWMRGVVWSERETLEGGGSV
jgi:hypothetical protein